MTLSSVQIEADDSLFTEQVAALIDANMRSEDENDPLLESHASPIDG